MSDPSTSPRARKAPARPRKPYPDFPLTPHPSGKWQKKIRGQIHYFGAWARRVNGRLERVPGNGWEDALKAYKEVADDLHAGRTPRVKGDGLTVGALCNHFLTAKLRQRNAGELTPRMFAEYKLMTDMVVSGFGANRLADDLAADDFAALRAAMVKRWGPLRVLNGVTRVKTIFRFAYESGLIDRPPRYGQEFKPPSASVLRRHKTKSPPKMLEADELRRLIDAAPAPLRAMILLGLNAGFGNGDVATLPLAAVNLETGWLRHARPKTGIDRRVPLWAETAQAIREAIDARPKPANYEACGLLFLTHRGTAWVRVGDKSRSDYVSHAFCSLLKTTKLRRPGLSFYALRHIHRTVADGAKDIPAARAIMGHVDAGIDAVYRERIDDARLKAVTDHVRAWLKGGAA